MIKGFRQFLFIAFAFFSSASLSLAVELETTIATIEARLSQPVEDFDKYGATLVQIQKQLYSINPLEFQQVLRDSDVKDVLNRLFTLKHSLRFSLKNLPYAYLAREDLSVKVKDVLSSIRYLEDYLYELSAEIYDIRPIKRKILPFSNSEHFAQKGASFDGQINSLKTGDVVLMRGIVFSSALIARISDAAQTYSHMGLVYVEPISNKIYIIEGMLNSGFQKTEITPDYFKDQGRVAVYRSIDVGLSKAAGDFGNSQYENGLSLGKPLEYDMTMGLEENCKYYCSKFISFVYNTALKKKLLPEHPSRLHFKNTDFVSSLGMPKSSQYTFAPSDIDLDTTFDLVYEFRNPKMTPSTRLDDLITDKLLYWMQTEGLEVIPGGLYDKTAQIVMMIASKNFAQRIINKLNIYINPNLDPKHLSILGAATITVMKIKKAILSEYKMHYQRTGFPMTPKQIYSLIEKTRQEKPQLTKQFKPRTFRRMCLQFFASV